MQLHESDLGFCWADFGNGLRHYSKCIGNSITLSHPDSEQLACKFDDVSKQISTIQKIYPFYKKSPGALKILMFSKGMKQLNSKWIIFTDKDMAILGSLLNIIEMANNDDIDFIITIRPNEDSRYINTGLLIVKKSLKVEKFINQWIEGLLKNLQNNQTDDLILQKLFDLDLSSIIKVNKEKLVVIDYNSYFDIRVKSFNLRFYSADILNNSKPTDQLTDKVLVQHFKGIQFLLIERNFLDLRFYKALIKIVLMNKYQYTNLISKLYLWQSYQKESHFLLTILGRSILELIRVVLLPARIFYMTGK